MVSLGEAGGAAYWQTEQRRGIQKLWSKSIQFFSFFGTSPFEHAPEPECNGNHIPNSGFSIRNSPFPLDGIDPRLRLDARARAKHRR